MCEFEQKVREIRHHAACMMDQYNAQPTGALDALDFDVDEKVQNALNEMFDCGYLKAMDEIFEILDAEDKRREEEAYRSLLGIEMKQEMECLAEGSP